MRVALVTGASSGIGRATALALAAAGRRVVATARDRVRGDALAREAAARGLALEVAPLEVDRDDSVRELFAALAARGATVDLLVNNAGSAAVGALEDTPAARWRELYEVNVLGAVRCCQAALPAMRALGAGHVINVGSAAGRAPLGGQAAYAASKAALAAASAALAQEVAPFGIRVTLVEPGVTVTPLVARQRAPEGTPYGATYHRLAALYRVLLPRAASADDVARVIASACAAPPAATRVPVGVDAEALLARPPEVVEVALRELTGAASELDYVRGFGAAFGLDTARAAPATAPANPSVLPARAVPSARALPGDE